MDEIVANDRVCYFIGMLTQRNITFTKFHRIIQDLI